jgi:hypothetical protein
MSIEEIKKKLIEYFIVDSKEESGNQLLTILDEGSDKSLKRGGYTGVTIPYIKQYVLQEEISDSKLFLVLGILISEKLVWIIYCPHIDELVVEHYGQRTRRVEEEYNSINNGFKVYNV